MARIEGVADDKAGPLIRVVYWYLRRRFGKVPEPVRLVAHHPTLFRGYGRFEIAQERSRLVDRRLKALAQIKAASVIGCPY